MICASRSFLKTFPLAANSSNVLSFRFLSPFALEFNRGFSISPFSGATSSLSYCRLGKVC